jgi:SAM-dependent methyltransferase
MPFYSLHADRLAPLYDAIAFERIHAPLLSWLPYPPAAVLDVGAGSGRDAAWFAAKGYEVVAVEPVPEMRAHAQAAHPHPGIRWMDDSLPALSTVMAAGLQFDLIHLSAVFMHLPKADRDRAFRKLTLLLKPGGRLYITLRDGPSEPERGLHEVPDAEMEALARAHGAVVEFKAASPDSMDRPEVSWRHLLFRLPDDGLGAMPLLRSVILNDDKSSTYKLALLRTVGRIANDSMAVSRDVADDKVAVPLGLVALYWLRAYLPLLKRNLPQSPLNSRGGERLGFVKEDFLALMSRLSEKDLRIGTPLASDIAPILHRALKTAADVIRNMPVRYTTYPQGGPVFAAIPVRMASDRHPASIRLAYLSSFGDFIIPQPLWLAFQRFNVWIDPTLTSEWARMMDGYATSQGRTISSVDIHLALEWSDPGRDVAAARARVGDLLASSQSVWCVWTGKRLSASNLDIDHCIPWSAWPCGDLWNLMPADRRVNQHQKRDRLPSAERLHQSSERIVAWWESGYVSHPGLETRFWQEAGTTLPGANASTSDLIDAIQLQRLRIHRVQQPREW